ncbi:MAG: hypothetical protein D6689_04235 [Deltaproteobacteria bacterium]|nr:MAG: hypothetical protein D6689_04235 [Deltaproteobacteria bacterium]
MPSARRVATCQARAVPGTCEGERDIAVAPRAAPRVRGPRARQRGRAASRAGAHGAAGAVASCTRSPGRRAAVSAPERARGRRGRRS